MQGSIIEAATLVAHGNEFLRARDVGTFWPGSSAFQFCKSVTFVTRPDQTQPMQSAPYAPDPLRWFERIRSDGAVGLRLHHLPGGDPRFPDRATVGFVGGGGRWLLEVIRPELSDTWEGHWETGDLKDPERRIWEVTYEQTRANHPRIATRQVGLEQLSRDLADVLTQISAFAEKFQVQDFPAWFQRGLAILAADQPIAREQQLKIAPEGALPPRHQQLLDAAQAAWVFGGMGSWNDAWSVGPLPGELYEELSEKLFNLLIQAVVEVTNSTWDGLG